MKSAHIQSPFDQESMPTLSVHAADDDSYRTMIDAALEAIAVHRDGKLIYVNRAAIRMMGAESARDLLGSPILDRVHPEFHGVVQARIDGLSPECPTTALMEERFIRLDGTEFDVEAQSTWITYGAQAAVQVAMRDITLQKQRQHQLEELAHFDPLTRLPNRALLSDRLQQAMTQAQRRGQRLAVVFLDLDGFKAINDRHGHDAGDQLLTALAANIKQTLRDGDSLARLGGDEFVVVLPDLADVAASEPMLNRLLAAVARPVPFNDQQLQVSGSLGVTFFPQAQEVAADQLLRQADQAMYQAKLAGKSRYRVFDVELDRSVREYHEKVQRIRGALAAQEFVLHYQPKVNLRSGRIVGAETLVRWQHPQKGLLAPMEFLPLIENHRLAVELGEWVINGALQQMACWQAEGLELPVSVNVSAHHLKQDGFAMRLGKLLGAHPQVNPSCLQLEMQESSTLEDMADMARVIEACAGLGVGFALARFGVESYSMSHLLRLPVKLLKIDQMFVREMLNGPDNLAILESLIGLGTAFRCQIIAEGVETPQQIAKLLQLGCDLAQGFGIAHPMPACEIPAWVALWLSDPSATTRPAARRIDDAVLYAGVEHRAWVLAVGEYLRGERDAPPGLESGPCHFGQWLQGEGLARHGGEPVFAEIAALHQRSHDLAAHLCALKAQGRVQEAQLGLTELQGQRETLFAYMQTLA
jgi:diguanylate cyclase (GGDEF)-like protein/PAS domain S-box-containing protein